MVHFHVIDHQVIDFCRIDDGPDVPEKIIHVRPLDGIEEGDLFVYYEKCVVGRALICRISVKIPDIPVNCPDPVDTFRQLCCPHDNLVYVGCFEFLES